MVIISRSPISLLFRRGRGYSRKRTANDLTENIEARYFILQTNYLFCDLSFNFFIIKITGADGKAVKRIQKLRR